MHAARLAASTANGHLPTNALRKATLSTAPLQAPPQHITDLSPDPSTQPPPLPASAAPLPAAADLAEGDAVVITSPRSIHSPLPPSGPPSSSSSSPASFSVVPPPGTEGGGVLSYVKARLKYKVVLLGDENVGKTSLLTRFMYDTFDLHYRVTIGIDFVSRTLHLRDRTVRLQLWDTAGQERFRSLIPSYIREAAVAVFVYDISSPQSFASIGRWVEDVHKDRGTDVLLVLVGSKSDLEAEGRRAVSCGEGERYAREHSMLWGEVSAKEGTGIQAMMRAIVALLPGEAAERERMEGFGSDKGQQGGAVDVQLTATPGGSRGTADGSGCQC